MRCTSSHTSQRSAQIEVFKLRQTMKQDDRLDFVASMKMKSRNTKNVTTDYSRPLIFAKRCKVNKPKTNIHKDCMFNMNTNLHGLH